MSLWKVCITVMSSLIIACGGGGGNGKSSSSSSVGGKDNTNGAYSVSVDKNTVKLDIQWNGSSSVQIVHVKFKGDGVIVGFPPNEITDSDILIETLNTTADSADFSISYMPGVNFSNLVTLKRKLRFISGKADGSKVVFVDIDVVIEQLDGFVVRGGAPSFMGVWGTNPSTMSFILSTAKKGWTVSSDFPGLTIEPKTGTGLGSVKVSYDFHKTPVSATSANITFVSSTGDKVEEKIQFKLTSPTLDSVPILNDVIAPEWGNTKQQIIIPINFTQQLVSVDVDWMANLPVWLSAEKLRGQIGQDQLILALDPANIPDSEGLHQGIIEITAHVLGQPIVQQIPIKLRYEKYRLQASRQTFAFADYGTSDVHTGIITLNSAVANEGAPLALGLVASASKPWVVIDSVSDTKVKFHLNVADMPQGSHLADINIASSTNPFVVSEKVKIGYYKTNFAVSTTPVAINTDMSLFVDTLVDKLRPWVYVAGTNKIFVFDIVTQKTDILFEADAEVRLGFMAISTDGQFLFFASNNGKLYKMDLINRTLLRTFETDFPYDYYSNSRTDMNFYRVNGKNFVGAKGKFYDADTGNPLIVTNDWREAGGMVLVPDAGAGIFEVDRGIFCGNAHQVNLHFSYIANAVDFNNSTEFTDEFCNSSAAALSANMQQFAVNRRDRDLGFYVDIFGFESLLPNKFKVTKLAEHNIARSEIGGIAMSSNGTLSLAIRYDDFDNKKSIINFYSADHTLSSTDVLPAKQINIPDWFLVTSDGKLLNYITNDLVTQEHVIRTKDVTKN